MRSDIVARSADSGQEATFFCKALVSAAICKAVAKSEAGLVINLTRY
jgi:hypothetical protein